MMLDTQHFLGEEKSLHQTEWGIRCAQPGQQNRNHLKKQLYIYVANKINAPTLNSFALYSLEELLEIA
jgi:hypothetical protein